jgi:hypothetical protein
LNSTRSVGVTDPMKTFLLILASAFVGVGVAVAAITWEVGTATTTPTGLGLTTATTMGPHAKVGIEQVLFDAKQVDVNSQQQHKFIFRNDGDALLRLNVGETSCQCTTSLVESKEVPPGQSTEVSVLWKTEHTGEFRHTATIMTNDPLRPRVALTVIGTVIPTMTVEPSEVILGNFSNTIARRAEVRIFSFLDEDFEITGHELVNPKTAEFFEVVVQAAPLVDIKGADAKSGFIITITIKPGLPGGPIQQTIRLKTNRANGSQLEIPIRGTAIAR